MRKLSVAQQFSKYPAGRYVTDGPWSGEAFREQVLKPALNSGDLVEVNLDGTLGYGSSFLEEAFGGLVRVAGFSLVALNKSLRLVCVSDPSVVDEVWRYVRDADRARSH